MRVIIEVNGTEHMADYETGAIVPTIGDDIALSGTGVSYEVVTRIFFFDPVSRYPVGIRIGIKARTK